MVKEKKASLTIILLASTLLSYINIDISTIDAGLGFLVVFYSSVLIILIGFLFYFMTRKTRKLKLLSIIFPSAGLLTLTQMLGDIGIGSRIFIIVVNGLAILGYLFSTFLIWTWEKQKVTQNEGTTKAN